MSPIVYLISGANRGLGLGFVKVLLRRDNVIIFAGARNPSSATELQALAKEFPEKLHIVKLNSADEAGNKAAVEEVKAKAGRLDVVIANAGINKYYGLGLETPAQEMKDHYEVNVIGPLVLFQATYPLLKASTNSPKFVLISSRTGSITNGAVYPWGILTYGASKAAANYLARKLHFENDGLIVFPICPGGVGTDMSGWFLSKANPEFSVPMLTGDEAAARILSQVDTAVRPADGPVFNTIDGQAEPW